MAWKKENEWGVSKEEMQDLVKNNSELPGKFTAMDGKIDSVKDEVKSEMGKITNTLSSFNEKLEEVLKQRTPNGGGKGGNTEENEVPSVLDDENGAFRHHLTPVVIRQLKLESLVKRDKILSQMKFGAILRDEIDKIIDKQPLNAQVDEELIKNTYKTVFADHYDEIKEAESKKEGRFFMEPTRSHGNSGPERVESNKDELTAEEKGIAKKWGMTEKEYLDTKKGMKYVG